MMDISEEKLGLGIGSIVSVVGVWVATHWFPGLQSSLSTVVGGIVAIYGIYCGAHVSNAWVQGKNGQADGVNQDVDASPFVEPHPDQQK